MDKDTLSIRPRRPLTWPLTYRRPTFTMNSLRLTPSNTLGRMARMIVRELERRAMRRLR